jgi:hypothetical protein
VGWQREKSKSTKRIIRNNHEKESGA